MTRWLLSAVTEASVFSTETHPGRRVAVLGMSTASSAGASPQDDAAR